MKQATIPLQNTIKRNVSIKSVPRLIAEWEHNRFSPLAAVTVTPAQTTTDPEWTTFYDLDSIALPVRPTTGVAKARLGTSKVKPTTTIRDTPNQARFYPSSATDPYKYFSTTGATQAAKGGDNGYAFASPPQITVTYQNLVATNKIVVGFETSYSTPRTWNVQTTNDGLNWNTVATGVIPASDGTVSLWRHADGGWDGIPDYTNPVMLKGVRINVTSMADPKAHLDVLQLGLRLENDLSSLVIGYSKSFEVSQRSFIAPMGNASSNEASVELSNFDLRFNNENSGSVYYGLIDKNVKLTMDLLIDASSQGGSTNEPIREFTMWADNWGGQDQDSVTVSLKDSSVFLQEEKIPRIFFENSTVGAIVWQILDLTGHTNYKYSRSAVETGQLIPYYWPEADRTIWEEISSLAEATQTAIYFDEYDILQIKTRKTMYDMTKTVDWNLDAVPNGQKLPDIIDASVERDMEANKVNVVYSPAQYSDFNNGLPKMETVWDPDEDTIVLRSSPLVRDLSVNGTDMWIKKEDAAVWPYETMINIRGEILKYTGKEYAYYNASGVLSVAIVKTQEEKDKIDETSSDNFRWKNYFTGRMVNLERGLLGTVKSDHRIRSANYTGVVTNYDNTKFRNTVASATYMDGFLRARSDDSDVHTYTLTKSDTSVLAMKSVMYGTRMRFPNSGWNVGGMWLAGDWGDAGYYLEISTTEHVDTIEQRTWRHELSLQVMPGNAPHIPVRSDNNPFGAEGDEGVKGFGWNLYPGQWFTVDVKWTYLAANQTLLTVFIDGVWAGDWWIGTHLNPGIAPPPNEGRFGVFVRGNCVVDYEYLYAIGYDYTDDPFDADASSFLDMVSGGFTSGYIARDWRYDFQSISPWYGGQYFPQNVNRAKYVFDEFGPQVHEVRAFEVEFKAENVPVSHSYPYISNSSQVACIAYESDVFGAKMLLANTVRQNAVVKGEDTLTFGPDNSVDHKIFIYGRCLIQEDERTITKTDDQGIRRRGVSQTEFSSRYIQTEEAANALGQWVIDLWGMGVDELSVTIFGNPLIQLGDLVTVNYPVKGMSPNTHKYFVVSSDGEYNNGLETSLVLRRAKF